MQEPGIACPFDDCIKLRTKSFRRIEKEEDTDWQSHESFNGGSQEKLRLLIIPLLKLLRS